MSAPDCLAVRAALEALVGGELPEHRAQLLHGHLATCPDCRRHHAEAISLPRRLAALSSPEAPPALLPSVLRQVRPGPSGALHVWGFLAAEALLVVVAGWYVSGIGGLLGLGGRTAEDVALWLGWLGGQTGPPSPAAGDVFLLLISGLLVLVTLVHLALLSRQALARPSTSPGEG